jgi:hypothetical protein
MRRFHALEWEDLSWFPKSWRDFGTDYLQFFSTKFDIYKPIVPILKKGIASSGRSEWVDLASGGGGGLLKLGEKLKEEIPNLKITLTDFFPNIKAFEKTAAADPDLFRYEPDPIDAKSAPVNLQGRFRTLFGAFHHFRPADAQKILQNAVDTHSPIAIFEPVGRNPGSIISMLFVIPNVLIFTLFIRPVRWKVIPFIYLLPLVPLFILWDGIASIIRVYSEREMRGIIARVKNQHEFDWEVGHVKNGPMPIYYLLGLPKEKVNN